MSTSPFGMVGDHTCLPKRTWLNTEPPRLAMPCTSLCLTSKPWLCASSASTLDTMMTPCPPTPTIRTLQASRAGAAFSGRSVRPGGGTHGGDRISHCITGATVLMQSTVQTCAHSVQPMHSDWSICTLWRPSNDCVAPGEGRAAEVHAGLAGVALLARRPRSGGPLILTGSSTQGRSAISTATPR